MPTLWPSSTKGISHCVGTTKASLSSPFLGRPLLAPLPKMHFQNLNVAFDHLMAPQTDFCCTADPAEVQRTASEAVHGIYPPGPWLSTPEALWKVLSRYGCALKFINILRPLHDEMTAAVLCNRSETDPFIICTGVKQGCIITLTLFSWLWY